MLVFLAGIVGFCLSGDLFNMFVFYELFSVAAYALAGYRTTDPGSVRGALNFAITNSVGAILLLGGIALLYGRTGALNLAQLGQSLATGPADRLVVVAFLLLMVGFFVKAAVVPFHFWLADAYALAPTVVGVLFAGVVSELGLYAVARVYWTVFWPRWPRPRGCAAHALGRDHGPGRRGDVPAPAPPGADAGVRHRQPRRPDPGRVRAARAGRPPGAVLYLVADGMVKARCSSRWGSSTTTCTTSTSGGWPAGAHFWLAALMVAGALGLAGMPPFGTFLGKALMEEAAVETGLPWLIGLFVVVAALTSAALLRATGRVFCGLGRRGARRRRAPVSRREAAVRHPHVHATQVVPAVGLLAGAVAVGLAPGLADAVQDAAGRFTDRPRPTRPPCSWAPASWPRPGPTRRSTSAARPCWRRCRRCSASGSRWPPSCPTGCRPACAAASPAPGARSRPRSVACTTAASATR